MFFKSNPHTSKHPDLYSDLPGSRADTLMAKALFNAAFELKVIDLVIEKKAIEPLFMSLEKMNQL